MSVSPILRLLRPSHWTKNLFVAAPALFSGTLTDSHVTGRTLIAFGVFCLASSCVYCFNDLHDAESDRNHPVKRLRPIASGSVGTSAAAILAGALGIASLIIPLIALGTPMVLVVMGYLAINLLYSNWLKRIALIDISVIAIGFVLRLVAGSIACHRPLSGWIVVTTFLLAIFLALGKRREDLHSGGTAPYSIPFIDSAMTLTGAAAIGVYTIYALSPVASRAISSDYLYLTCFPVTIGILRYMQISLRDNKGSDHIRILYRDPVIALSLLTYLTIFIVLWLTQSP